MSEHPKLAEAFDAVSDVLHARNLTVEQYTTVYARLLTALMHDRPGVIAAFMKELFENLNNLDQIERGVWAERRKRAGV